MNILYRSHLDNSSDTGIGLGRAKNIRPNMSSKNGKVYRLFSFLLAALIEGTVQNHRSGNPGQFHFALMNVRKRGGVQREDQKAQKTGKTERV
jgi:hypothetical protein